jgi:small redox-active disulfide protein 2
MLDIKILGTGCPKCKRLEAATRQAVIEAGVEATVAKVSDIDQILDYDVMMTPGLVINGEVKSAGRVPPKDDIIAWLQAE